LRKFLYLILGWTLLIVGLALTPAPVPIPLIGIVPLLLGCAILSQHSRRFRRFFQWLRHRYRFISRWLENFAHRAPASVHRMLRRTNPRAIERFLRRRLRAHHRKGEGSSNSVLLAAKGSSRGDADGREPRIERKV
jgi:hypothetical protein